jgi:predicted transcriptional regulator
MMTSDTNAVELATELTIAWLSNPNTRTSSEDVPAFLASMHDAVAKLAVPAADQTPDTPAEDYTPAVSVRKSLASKDHIISMIDGKPYKTLRRHLATNGLTPEEYRARYNLRSDYPMVAENYSESRRAMAKSIGLGRKARPESDGPAPAPAEAAPAESAPAPAKPRRAPKAVATPSE